MKPSLQGLQRSNVRTSRLRDVPATSKTEIFEVAGIALLLYVVVSACGADPLPPSTPLPAAAALPAATSEPPATTRVLPTFTPVPTVGVSTPTVVPSVAPTPLSSPVPPQPLPSIYLDYKDRLHQGWRGSVCWPYQVNMGSVKWGSSCPATAGWRGFDEVSPITIKSEDQFSMVIAAHTPPDRLMTRVFTVLSTVPSLSRGEELFRHDASSPGEAEEITLGLPPGVYYLDASVIWLGGSIGEGSPEGSVGYGFKVEIAEPPPPPLPQVSLEHGGRSYRGWRGSYCWPTSANSRTCADSVGWQGFDKASPVLMKQGDKFSIRISGSDPTSDEFRVRASTPQETRLAVKPGEELFSSDSLEGLRLDLPAGVYFVSTFYKSPLGDVSYGFKVEVVD